MDDLSYALRKKHVADPNTGIKPLHRQIVMMHLAGMSEDAIARFLDTTQKGVSQILALPSVQRYMLQLQASYMEDFRPIAERVNQSIANHTERAAQVVVEIMEDMHRRDEIKAQALALHSAKDILDRAGHKATTKVETKNLHGHVVAPETLEHMAAVLKELNGS